MQGGQADFLSLSYEGRGERKRSPCVKGRGGPAYGWLICWEMKSTVMGCLGDLGHFVDANPQVLRRGMNSHVHLM